MEGGSQVYWWEVGGIHIGGREGYWWKGVGILTRYLRKGRILVEGIRNTGEILEGRKAGILVGRREDTFDGGSYSGCREKNVLAGEIGLLVDNILFISISNLLFSNYWDF